MGNNRKQAAFHRRVILVAVTVIVAVVALAVYSVWSSRSQRYASSPLIGTWKGQVGNVLDFRPDGTARSRLSTGPKIHYFEWELNSSNELLLYFFSTRNSVKAWIVRASRAVGRAPPMDRMKIIEISPTQMKLQSTYPDPKSGKTVTTVTSFVRTEDEQLEAAR